MLSIFIISKYLSLRFDAQAIFFSTQIFRTAGLSDSHAGLATVGMSVVNLLTTIVSFSIVERSGRRTLLLIGYCGMGLVSIVLMIALATYVSILSIICLKCNKKFCLIAKLTMTQLVYLRALLPLSLYFIV